jgi:hypothetical protein
MKYLAMRIFVGVLRISTILAFAVLTTSAARAQSDHDSDYGDSCADVKPPVVNPQEKLDNIPFASSRQAHLDTAPFAGQPRPWPKAWSTLETANSSSIRRPRLLPARRPFY